MGTLREMAEEFVRVRDSRRALEDEAGKIKNGREKELEQAILLEMTSEGIKTINLEGIGRVTNQARSHWEITDIETLAQQMFKCMLESLKAGRACSDGLLLQRRVSKEQLESFIEKAGATNEDAARAAFGVKQVSENSLSITKNK